MTSRVIFADVFCFEIKIQYIALNNLLCVIEYLSVITQCIEIDNKLIYYIFSNII